MASSSPEYHPPFSLSVNTQTTRDPCVVTLVITVLALLTSSARLLSRKYKEIRLGPDDYFMLAAMVFTICLLAEQWVAVIQGGMGHHVADIQPSNVQLVLKILLSFEIIYSLSMGCIKISFLFFYLRLFGTDHGFRRKVQIVGFIVLLWVVQIMIETFSLCRPFRYNWDTSIANGSCGNRNVVFVVAGATNMLTDLIVMFLPIPTIWRLKLNTSRKLGVIAIFALGTFVSVISIIRLVYLLAIKWEDPTYSLPQTFMWSILEPAIAIINANLPIVRPFIKHLFPKFFSSISDRYTSYYTRGTNATGGQYVDPQKHFERVTEGTYPLYPLGQKGNTNTQISRIGAEDTYANQEEPKYVVNVRSDRKDRGQHRAASPEALGVGNADGKNASKYSDPDMSFGDSSSQDNISINQVPLPEDGKITVKTEWNITSVSR